jgi:predicted Zn-dependent protease
MLTEIERSKAQLKLEGTPVPYYIEYRINDLDQYLAEAAFGAVRNEVRTRFRMVRVVVRIGNYKQDSYYGQGQGVFEIGPLDDDLLAIRHQLWLATDQAYKAAAESFASKQAELKDLSIDTPVDDFSPGQAVQFSAPLAQLEYDPQPYRKLLEEASALYRSDPEVQSLSTGLRFLAANTYFVSSEGAVVRNGNTVYQFYASASTQAADGMSLVRGQSEEVREAKLLPSREQFMERVRAMVATLRELRQAPVSEEQYRGPVLFSGDAAATVVATLVGPNVLGNRPQLGRNGRTSGAWANNYKSRVLPDFLTIFDDPTLSTFDGQTLLGTYTIDDEGVKASRISVIEKGQLLNYLMARTPIRDFPLSNGHGRMGNVGAPVPSIGNLIVQSSEALSDDELKQKLIALCRDRGLEYGYFVKTLGPSLSPRLLYRVYVKDGHEEVVRGAVFGDLDVRSLRSNIVAAGKSVTVENRLEPAIQSVASPALLFDELEVKRADASKEKLPEYPPPPLGTN